MRDFPLELRSQLRGGAHASSCNNNNIMSASGCECLVIGPEGTGKTLLLRKLQALCVQEGKRGSKKRSTADEHEGVLPTMATVGTNVEELRLGKNLVCTLREFGGSMAPLWSSAYADCHMVVYVVDISRPAQISASTVLLLEVLAAEALKEKPFLLFFNKTDSPFGMSLVEFKSTMRLGDILASAPQAITVIDGSCVKNEGVTDILGWISEHVRQKKRT